METIKNVAYFQGNFLLFDCFFSCRYVSGAVEEETAAVSSSHFSKVMF